MMMMDIEKVLFNESIHDMIKPEAEEVKKPARYVSTHAKNTGVYYKANKQNNASLGPAKVPLREPKSFLKSHEKKIILPEKQKFGYKDEHTKKPPIPTTAPSYGNKSQKNFLVDNPLEVINSEPKKRGSKEPVYREKVDYGRAPAYLSRRQKESIEEAPAALSNAPAAAPQPGVKMLSDTERKEILQGLKENWESVNDDYQKLSLTVDTPPKIARKTVLERTLKQLEKDIERMSFAHVFVKS